MQLLFILMAASSASAFECACRGVRGDGAGWDDMCRLGLGGNITAEYVYELEVRPTVQGNLTMTQACNKMQKNHGEAFAAEWYAKLRDRAKLLQEQEGGLYRGSNSGVRGSECVRSVFCNIDQGRREHGQSCLACWLVLMMPAPHRRAAGRDAASASNSSMGVKPDMNHRFQTAEQSSKRLKTVKQNSRVDKQRGRRHDLSHAAIMEAAAERYKAAEGRALKAMAEMGAFAREAATREAGLQARVDAAVAAQMEAEKAAGAALEANKSLLQCALEAAAAEAAARAEAQQLAQLEAKHAKQAAKHEAQLAAVEARSEVTLDNQAAKHVAQMAAVEARSEARLAATEARSEAKLAKQAETHEAQLATASAVGGRAVEEEYEQYFHGLPTMIQNLMIAHKRGELEKNATTVELLDGITTCLKNGSTRGRKLNDSERAFYGMLLNSGSPWAHKFVANNLFGPNLRTSQKTRSAFDHKLVELDLTHQSLVGLKAQLTRYGLAEVPGVVSEDATTSVRRLDFELLQSTTAESAWEAGVKLWGFDGGCVVVHSIDELREDFKQHELAAYVYVYTWVPILPHAPWFPFAIIATNNKFDASWVFTKWRLIQESCSGLNLALAGHVSDGDARLRKCDFRINFGTNSLEDPLHWCKKVHASSLHSLLYLTIPETIEGLWLLGFQDYMHLLWRLRVQMLSPRKVWQIGPGLTTAASHLTDLRNTKGDVLLNGRDLDPHNKQHWPGVVKMFNTSISDALKARIDGPDKEEHLRGTHAVIMVFSCFLNSWLSDRDADRKPTDAIRDAAFVMAFCLHWRYFVNDRFKLTENFLTRETCLDLITGCHCCILRFVQFRECWGGRFKPDGPRFSSAYSEYIFQYGRMAQTNSPVVSVKGWFTHLQHYLYQQSMESDNPGLKIPQSCRGIPHSIERVQIPTVDPKWHPSDEQITAAIDVGVQQAIELLVSIGIDTNLSTRNGFFSHPWKHFPLKDRTYAAAMAETGEKEDDPATTQPDEPVDQTVLAAQDAADIDAVLGQLMRTGLQAGDQQIASDTSAVLEEVSALLAAFNQTIQDESKDRKYRFHVKRLLKAHLRAGDAIDPDLDYITDDDDLAVLFTLGNGSHVWVLGNVEAVAVARGTVDKARAVGTNAASYLRGLDADERPIKGVHINDPKAMFLLRWYQEVDSKGKVFMGRDRMPTYQNKGCKSYYLPLDNGCFPFEWTSNLQVITAVHLKPLKTKNRMYTMPAADKQTVEEAMKKM
jgi:hypothetical protein